MHKIEEIHMETHTRTLVSLVAFFIATTLSLIGIISWREFNVHQEDTRFTLKNFYKYYPHIFGLQLIVVGLNKSYDDILLDAYNNRTPTTSYFEPLTNCSYDCKSFNSRIDSKVVGNQPKERSQLYHACCKSNATVVRPYHYKNLRNITRELVQFDDRPFPIKQVFLQEECSQGIGCTGCTCEFVHQITSAVVYKQGYTSHTATDMSHVEVDLFELQGCCKCVNKYN